MSRKTSNIAFKSPCDRSTKHSSTCSKSEKSVCKPCALRKTCAPKKRHPHPAKEGKSCSTGIAGTFKKPPVVKPKKTTKSEVCFPRKAVLRSSLDICGKCGDVRSSAPISNGPCSDDVPTYIENVAGGRTPARKSSNQSIKLTKSTEKIILHPKNDNKTESVLYKNENFGQTSHSAYEIDQVTRKITSLVTIKEVPEKTATEEPESHDTLFRIHSDSESEDSRHTDNDAITKLKEFRNKNYFECHSAKSRVTDKASVISLENHKCVYRFYLNDRLFPVPLNEDHNKNIRCVECHLPLELNKDLKDPKGFINGTIQAKVKMSSGDTVQDMILMLPVKETLIIKEKRLERPPKVDREVVYFGVIKLTSTGDSVFKKNLPSDSMALKYQKGFKEFDVSDRCEYESVYKGDVIII